MIDPRFANAGAVPLVHGYGAQQVPVHHHRHRQHRHHSNKHGHVGASPLSRDESIHKVDHAHHHFRQNDGVPLGSGYGVPYGTGNYGNGVPGGFHQQPQQQQFGGGNFGYGNQYQGNAYAQGQFGGPPAGNTHRHHHRHHRHHGAEAVAANGAGVHSQGVPEQLIGQRSSSVIGSETQQVRSPVPTGEGKQASRHRRHRHHRHHHSDERGNLEQTHQSRQTRAHQSHNSVGADGYGHINDDLIFIERGQHSPHRQEPPSGYEYKGKIEVQGVDKQVHSGSHGHGQYVPPQSVAPPQSAGPCPPGWQQMVLTAAPGGPCPPGGSMYTGQVIGAADAGFGGIGGFSGVGPIGARSSGGGLANLAASFPIPPRCQLVADYLVGSSGGGVNASSGSGFATGYQQGGGGAGFTEQYHSNEGEELASGKTTVIEVWQKRSKSETREKSRSRSRDRKPEASVDFDRLRDDILAAIGRIVQDGGPGGKVQWTGTDGGTQTQIHPSTGGFETGKETKSTGGSGEVRVIVQPIQPVFYMPRQTQDTTAPQVGPGPAIQQPSRGAPTVVYVPRNVYVPVIKPVFVPRERVIVRPQVIHVARPVLVDRPVPVTQRPIIIDRERSIPVPVRGGGGGVSHGQAQTHAETSSATREEYAYGDNLPVAYGGGFNESAGGGFAESTGGGFAESAGGGFDESAGGADYGYTNTQQEHQYATNSTHEGLGDYQAQEPEINMPPPEQYQHSQSASHLDVQQSAGSFRESYSNLAQTNRASGAGVVPLHCTEPIEVFNPNVNSSWQHTEQSSVMHHRSVPIEVLDSTVSPAWQRTDQSSLVRRYGHPAYDIVRKTDQVEQQMYQELRQRSSSSGIQRSSSAASYASGSGIAGGGGGGGGGSFSTNPHGDIHHLHPEDIHHQGSASIPVRINY